MVAPLQRNIIVYQGATLIETFPYAAAAPSQVGIAEIRAWAGGPLLARAGVDIDTVEKTVTLSLSAEQTTAMRSSGEFDVIVQRSGGRDVVVRGKAVCRSSVSIGAFPDLPTTGYGQATYDSGSYSL